MTRPLRIEYENACYHVMNRGRGRQRIFHDDGYYEAFLQSVVEAHRRFGLELVAYCLMSNHYHLLLKTPRGNLSRIMRHIDGLYTQRHNRLKRTDGSLFRGRYKALLIDASSYLLQVSRYIHRNPIETTKPLVRNLDQYQWSSYPSYINKAPVLEGLNRDLVYAELGQRNRFAAYRNFVMRGNDDETTDFYDRSRTPAIMGDREFAEKIGGKARYLDTEIERQAWRHPVEMDLIVTTVAKYYAIGQAEIVTTRRGRGRRNIARWIAMKLCQDLASARLVEIAEKFNVGHYATVSKTIGRLNRLMQEDEQMESVYKLLSQDLTP